MELQEMDLQSPPTDASNRDIQETVDGEQPTRDVANKGLVERQASIDMEEGNAATDGNGLEHSMVVDDTPCVKRYVNKGSISNGITFLVMVIGIIAYTTSKDPDTGEPSQASKYILSIGLFGFAGGVTNWLAVKMLFDRIPFIVGSGVIPRQFKAIRQTVKDTIMNTFFDTSYLKSYLTSRAKGFLADMDISGSISSVLDKPEVDALMVTKLTELAQTPEGAVLNMAAGFCGGMEGLSKMIKPLVAGFGAELGPILEKHLDVGDMVDIDKIRDEIDLLMTEKLKLLTPQIVKRLMEQVIRDHLGWLIVWGNVFGGLIGVISQAAGFGA